MKKIMIYSSILLITGLTFQQCSKPVQGKEAISISLQEAQNVVKVTVDTLRATTAPIPVYTSGLVKAQDITKLSFKVGGIIKAIYVREGSKVKKGQVLARIQPTEINNKVQQTQLALEKAERDLARAEGMYKDSILTYENLQNLKTARQAANSNYEIARFNQKYANIYAPFDGQIRHKLAESGEVVNTGTPVLVISSKDQQSVVEIGLTDKEYTLVNLSDSATILFDAFPNKPVKAYVSDIATTSDPQIGLYRVELSFTQTNRVVPEGFFGQVILYPSNQTPYFRVPFQAISRADKSALEIYSPDSSAQARALKLNPYRVTPDFIVVPAGSPSAAITLISEGSAYLKEGDTIAASN